jgi:hypothetical protein
MELKYNFFISLRVGDCNTDHSLVVLRDGGLSVSERATHKFDIGAQYFKKLNKVEIIEKY